MLLAYSLHTATRCLPSHTNPYNFFSHSFVMHFNIILPSKSRFTKIIEYIINFPISSVCPVILISFDNQMFGTL